MSIVEAVRGEVARKYKTALLSLKGYQWDCIPEEVIDPLFDTRAHLPVKDAARVENDIMNSLSSKGWNDYEIIQFLFFMEWLRKIGKDDAQGI